MERRNPVITVVGSFNTDLMARSPRMPRAGETILGGPFQMGPGGKGANQAVATARLGSPVFMVSCVGEDVFGDLALSNLSKEGVDISFVARDSTIHTGAALIVVDEQGENMIVVAPGANFSLTPDMVGRATRAIREADVLLTQLEIPTESVERALRIAKDNQVTTILNPAPARVLSPAILKYVDVLTPNRSEASLLTGIEITNQSSIRKAAERLFKQGVETVVFTLGSEGALIVTSEKFQHIPGQKVQVVDTTGAGDAFNGGLAFALSRDDDLVEAVRFANAVAALSVTKVGTAPSMPTKREVTSFLNKASS